MEIRGSTGTDSRILNRVNSSRIRASTHGSTDAQPLIRRALHSITHMYT